VVADALMWLKTHNAKYYGDIMLDHSRLHTLPADDVPDEILATIHQEHDANCAVMEEDGYVPADDPSGEF